MIPENQSEKEQLPDEFLKELIIKHLNRYTQFSEIPVDQLKQNQASFLSGFSLALYFMKSTQRLQEGEEERINNTYKEITRDLGINLA